MFDSDHSTIRLDEQQCWTVLSSAASGTLAVSFAGQPDVFAVEFQVQGEKVLVRTPQGEMLVQLTINPVVAFEATGTLASSEWSVVVKGTARELHGWTEIEAIHDESVRPWTRDGVFVEIIPTLVVGRRIRAGFSPE